MPPRAIAVAMLGLLLDLGCGTEAGPTGTADLPSPAADTGPPVAAELGPDADATAPPAPDGSSTALDAQAPTESCAAHAASAGFELPLCETGGNNLCAGKGDRTTDCDHCCEAPHLPCVVNQHTVSDPACRYLHEIAFEVVRRSSTRRTR